MSKPSICCHQHPCHSSLFLLNAMLAILVGCLIACIILKNCHIDFIYYIITRWHLYKFLDLGIIYDCSLLSSQDLSAIRWFEKHMMVCCTCFFSLHLILYSWKIVLILRWFLSWWVSTWTFFKSFVCLCFFFLFFFEGHWLTVLLSLEGSKP